MANKKLTDAKNLKNDEFYTQYHDIEVEMNSYLEYDPNVFRGKTVLLPCDDPESSNFTRFFAAKFEELGLKKLISTSYAPDSKKYKTTYIPSLFELEAPQFDNTKTRKKAKYLFWNAIIAETDVSILMISNGNTWRGTEIFEAMKFLYSETKQILLLQILHSLYFVSSWHGLWKQTKNSLS